MMCSAITTKGGRPLYQTIQCTCKYYVSVMYLECVCMCVWVCVGGGGRGPSFELLLLRLFN